MKSCIGCMFTIFIIVIIGCGGFYLYLNKGCGITIDKVLKTEKIDYSTGDKWVVHGNNSDYVVAGDPIFSITSPDEFINSLEIGKTYKFKSCGWDIPLIKYNKIIINAQEIK